MASGGKGQDWNSDAMRDKLSELKAAQSSAAAAVPSPAAAVAAAAAVGASTSSSASSASAKPAAAAAAGAGAGAAKVQPAWKHFVAGNLGGVVGLCVAYPLDTVKVRMQTRPKGTYTGIWNCMSTMARTEGVGSLYRGLLSPVLGYGLIKATAFSSYAKCKALLTDHGWRKHDHAKSKASGVSAVYSLPELLAAGVGAGLVQSFVRAPVEQIKVVMQARTLKSASGTSSLPPYKGSLHCLREVVKAEGVRVGLYRGMNATVLREMPQYGIYYPTYELLARASVKRNNGAPPTKLQSFLAGGAAGVLQWAPTYSFDVVKSYIQAAEPGTYKSVWHCAQTLYRTQGISVFGRGFGACMLRAFPLHGSIFVFYELTMKALENV